MSTRQRARAHARVSALARRASDRDPVAVAGACGDLARSVLGAVGTHGDVLSCALAVADASATLTHAARVSIGVRRGEAARLLAVSGESAPDRRRESARRLEASMTAALARGEGLRRLSAASCTLVHTASAGVAVVAVLEGGVAGRPAMVPLDSPEASGHVAEIVSVLALLGVLERGARREKAGTFGRLRERLVTLGDGGTRRRLLLAACAVLLAAAVVAPLPYRVSARVSIEASDRQVVAAPHAGHLESAHVRAGDRVVEGQLLATLDARETILALERLDGERAGNRAEQAMALSARDRVALARLRAEAARIDIERSLNEQRLARGELRAPFDGVVLSGDPGRALGAPLEAGATLFELASSGRRSLLVEIDEHDVGLVGERALAHVRMAAAPRQALAARLDEVMPLAVAEPDGSVFRVQATFIEPSAALVLRPGMQGVARIEAGRRSLVDAWTRPVRQRLLLLGWKLGLVR